MAHTGWLDTLRDNPDNVAYLSPSSGDVLALNTLGSFVGDEFWVPRVWGISSGGVPAGRSSEYAVQGLPGHDPSPGSGAEDCVWGHAVSGVGNETQSWSGTCLDIDLSDPTGLGSFGLIPSSSLQYSPGGTGVAPQMEAEISIPARGIWLRHLLDNLGPQGILPLFGEGYADPEADGVPAHIIDLGEYDFEWEPDSDLELLGAYVAGDTQGGPHSWTDQEKIVYVTNDAIYPPYSASWGDDLWNRGALGLMDDGTGRVFMAFNHNGSSGYTWHAIDPTSFEQTAATDAAPDCMIGWTTNASYTGIAPGLPGGGGAVSVEHTPDGYPALKVELRAPRYRWVWEGSMTVPPRRILGRPHAGRIFGNNTVQGSNRTLGGIL